MDALKTNLRGLFIYRGRGGQLSFILHRLTGLGTLLFLIIHIVETSTVYFFPSLYEHGIALWQNTVFMIGEIILVFCVIYHGVNGVRIAIADLFSTRLWRSGVQSRSVVWTLGLSIILWIPAAILMGRSILIYNFGL